MGGGQETHKAGNKIGAGSEKLFLPPPPPPAAPTFYFFSSFSPRAFARFQCFPAWAQTVLACVQTSPISFAERRKGNRRRLHAGINSTQNLKISRDENTACTLQIIRPSRSSDGHADLAISSRATVEVKTVPSISSFALNALTFH